jgi:hypothetical protein
VSPLRQRIEHFILGQASPFSLVGKVTGYSSILYRKQELLVMCITSRRALGPTQSHSQWASRVLARIKRPEREVFQSFLSSTGVFPYPLSTLSRCSVTHRDNFTVTFYWVIAMNRSPSREFYLFILICFVIFLLFPLFSSSSFYLFVPYCPHHAPSTISFGLPRALRIRLCEQ